MNSALWNDEQKAVAAKLLIYRELGATTCACGATKKARQTFCRVHYFALPVGMREALYDVDGYVEAYRAACEKLGLKEPAERRETL